MSAGVPTTPNITEVNLTWADTANNEDGFELNRATDSNFTQNLTVFSLAANTTDYCDTGLMPNTYYYRVRAFNSQGVSGYSNVDSAVTSEGHLYQFETDEGYTTTGGTGGGGNLVGQPSLPTPKWANTNKLFTVQSGIGVSGQAVISAPSTINPAIAAYGAVLYNVAASDFQGDTDPVTAGFTGRIDYSFYLNVNSAPNNGSAAQAWFIRLGTGAAEFFLMANGTFKINSSGGAFTAKTTQGGGTDFDFDTYGLNNFVLVNGTIDYAADTFTCFVNGIQQQAPGGATDIPVANGSTDTRFDCVRFQNNSATNSTGYVQMAIDNLCYVKE